MRAVGELPWVPAAQTQTPAAYPNKPIKLIVPFPAAGGGNSLARLVMLRAAKELGQPVLADNLGGAGENVGSAAAAKAPADGCTLLYGTNGTLAINHAIYKAPGFSPTKDFAPVT